MASAPPPPPDDALPSYEEAVSSGTAFNTVNTRSYDSLPRSLPRSRADTGEYKASFHAHAAQQEEDDVETALLKAELQRLRQENQEAKKQLLRQEIENERIKAGASLSGATGSTTHVYPVAQNIPYTPQPPVPYSLPQPQPQPSSSTSPDANETEDEEDDCKVPQRICCTFIGIIFAIIILMIILT